LPGPVTVFTTKLFKLTFDAPKPTPTAASAATVLIEIFVAPAMVMRLEECRPGGGWDGRTRNEDRGNENWRGGGRPTERRRFEDYRAQERSQELKKDNNKDKYPQWRETDRAEDFSLAQAHSIVARFS
jgi:hypothetical protein